MPVTDPVKRVALVASGIDPDTVSELQPLIPVTEAPQQQPTTVNTPKVESNNKLFNLSDYLGANAREAIRGIPGAATGFGVGSAVAEATLPAVAIPIVGPFIPPVAGLVAGAGAAGLERYLQTKASKSVPSVPIFGSESESKDSSEHNLLAGQVASQLPFMGLQNLSGIQGAGRAIRDTIARPITQVAANPADTAALANIVAGATIPTAQEYGEQAYQQGTIAPKLDYKELATQAALGALVSRARDTKLNAKLGIHPQVDREFPLAGAREAQINGTPYENMGPKALLEEATPSTIEESRNKTIPPVGPVQLERSGRNYTDLANEIKNAPANPDVVAEEQAAQDAIRKRQAVETQIEENKKIAELKAQQEEETKLQKEQQANVKAKEDQAFGAEELQRSLQNNQTPTGDNFNPKTNPQKTFTKGIEKSNIENEKPLSEGEKIQEEYDKGIREQSFPEIKTEEGPIIKQNELEKLNHSLGHIFELAPPSIEVPEKITTPLELLQTRKTLKNAVLSIDDPELKSWINEFLDTDEPVKRILRNKSTKNQESSPVNSQLAEQGISSIPTKELVDKFKRLGALRNVSVDDSGRVFSRDTGKEIAGEALMRQGLEETVNKINPNKMGLDTPAHELFHVFANDLETHGTPAEKKMMAEAKAKFFGEEPLTSAVGADTVRRVLSTDNKGDFKNWLSDFWSHVKRRMGKASNEDYARVLSSRLINDPSFNDSFGKSSAGRGGNDEQNTRGEEGSSNVKESIFPTIERSGAVNPTTGKQEKELTLGFNKPEITKIEQLQYPGAKDLAKNLRDYYEKLTELRGRFQSSFLRPVKSELGLHVSDVLKGTDIGNYIKQDSADAQAVRKHVIDIAEGKKPTPLTTEQNKIKSILDTANSDKNTVLKQAGLPIPKNDYNYLTHIPSREVSDKLSYNKKSNPAERTKLEKDFIDYQTSKGLSIPEAQQNLDNYKSTLNRENLSTTSLIDKPDTVGIPESWRDKNLLQAQQRYMEKVARRVAKQQTLESPATKKTLADLAQNAHVATVMKNISGIRGLAEDIRDSATGFVKSMKIGPFTGLKNFVVSYFKALQYHEHPLQSIKTTYDAVSHINENIADSFKTGRNRENLNALELSNGFDDTLGALKRFRNVVSEATGANWLEQMQRAINLGQGKSLAYSYHQDYLNGKLSAQGKQFFKNFGEGINWQSKTLSKDDFAKLGARVVDTIQGTYDYRQLPHYAVEGSMSPIFSLARWSLGEANNFAKYVVSPALNGNPRPLVWATVGGLVGGEAVEHLVKLITGRKEKTPDYEELKNGYKNNKDIRMAAIYKATGLANASGYAGALGSMANSVMDVAYGKTKPEWYNNILLDTASNVASTVGDYAHSVNENGWNPDVFMDFASRLIEDNVQAGRLIIQNASEDKKSDIEKGNKFRDLRVFNMIEGNDLSDQTANYTRPFKHENTKVFKDTEDLNEAAKLVPELVKKGVEKSKGDPFKFEGEMAKLKENSYQTMPSLDNMPEFAKYYRFLVETQGKEEADSRMKDYYKHKMLNEIKSGLIP